MFCLPFLARRPAGAQRCVLASGRGGEGREGRRGLVPALPGPGLGVPPSRGAGPGEARPPGEAEQKREGTTAAQRAPAAAPRSGLGQRSPGGAGAVGPGEAQGAEKREVGERGRGGKRGKSKSAMMPAPTPLRAINTSGVVGIRSQRVNYNHPLPIGACLPLDAFVSEQSYNRVCFPSQKERTWVFDTVYVFP